MKEILFELNDGQIVGLTTIGLVAVWLLLTSLLTACFVYVMESGGGNNDPIGDTIIGVLVSGAGSAVLISVVRYWRYSLMAAGIITLVVSPSVLAYRLAKRRR